MLQITDNGKASGYLVKEYNLNFFYEIRDLTSLWTDSTFYLLDGNRNIIAATSDTEIIPKLQTSFNERSDFNNAYNNINWEDAPIGTIEYQFDSTNYITSYALVPSTDWIMYLSVNLDENFVLTDILTSLVLFVIVVCIFLTICFYSSFHSIIMTPLNQLALTLKTVRECDDYSLRIERDEVDELGEIFYEVNTLLSHIENNHIKEIAKNTFESNMLQGAVFDETALRTNIIKIKHTIDQYVLHKRSCALLLVDLDNFSRIDLEYGRAHADMLLHQFHNLLNEQFREQDIVVHLGQDDFLILITNTSDLPIITKKARIICSLPESLSSEQVYRLNLTASVGIALCPEGGTNYDSLYENAKKALYDAKTSGKFCACYY